MTEPNLETASSKDAGQAANTSVRLRNVNKWTLSPLHERQRFAKNESLNSLIEFSILFWKAGKLFRSYDTARSVDEGTLAALRNVSLDLERGTAVAVIDPDAIGKHALVQLVGHGALPNGGAVYSAGRVINLGILTSLVLPTLTARENLALLCDLIDVERSELDAAIAGALEVGGPQDLLDLPVRRIGVRAFSELALATVTSMPFEVLVAEEILPTRHPQLRAKLKDRYRQNLANGQTILFSSRNLEPIVELSTHLVLIKDGAVIEFGPTEQLLSLHGDWIDEALKSSADVEVGQIASFDAFDDEFEEEAFIDEEAEPLLDGEIEPERLGARAGAQPPEAPDSEPRPAAAAKLRKTDYLKLGSVDYETREIASCRLVEGPSEPVMFSETMQPLERMQQGERKPKVVDIESPFSIRVTLETSRPGLRLLPMVDLFAGNLPAVRSRPDQPIEADQPGRLQVRVDFPANLLSERFYVVHLAVLVLDANDESFEDLMIHRHLDFFDARRSSSFAASPDGTTLPAKTGPVTLAMVAARQAWQLEHVAPQRLVETRSIALLDSAGGSLLDAEAEIPSALLPAVVPLRAILTVEVYRGGLSLNATAELWIGRALALRVESDDALPAREAGLYELGTEIPAELLLNHSYRLAMLVTARDPQSGESGEARHPVEPLISFEAAGGDEGASKGAVRALDCIAPPVAQVSLPWRAEVLSMAPSRPER